MSGSILRIHEDSTIDFGKVQVFFSNDHESPQWPKPKRFGKMGEIWVSTKHMY